MTTAVIKDMQIVGNSVEFLAVADDGVPYRVLTDGTLASLKAGLQQATKKASDFKTKPEIVVGQTVDFTPSVVVPPATDPIADQWWIDYRAELTALALASVSQKVRDGYKPDYGPLR